MTVHLLSSHFNDVPLMACPEMESQLDACIRSFSTMEHASAMLTAPIEMSDAFWPEAGSWQASYRPYNVQNGILTIPVKGALLNDFGFATPWATGYQYIQKAWERGMADPDVKGVVLKIDSGGGAAAGNMDLVDKMTASKSKPVLAIVENGYSAAYGPASTADTISVSRTGGLGSIGVVTGHMDQSAAMEKAGLKFTPISAPEGGDKTAGNSFEPLADDHRARMQARVNELYDHFASTMARNRGVTRQAIDKMKARTFTPSQALSNGLGDKIAAPDDALASFSADLSSQDGDNKMSTKTDGTVEMAAHEAAVTEARAAGVAQGHAAGLKEGAVAERARISAILGSDEGKKRPRTALSTALKSDMSAEGAAAFMADLPEEAASAAATAAEPASVHANPVFKQVMERTPNPNIVQGDAENAVHDPKSAESALAAAHAFGVPGLRKPDGK